eukprot:TRINITY_DN642_c0_g1_i1.p1 TRINITY_DN642_c0_g1~~TRINITY_DN642_c0_g1_i1.p1  ORF type:complete len:566 (+),score=193.89 TRINITY_DN642_c0_g1_i1:23-1699(+)
MKSFILILISLSFLYALKYEGESRFHPEFIQKQKLPTQWQEMDNANLGGEIVSFMIAIKYRNRKQFDSLFEKITDPKSPEYGKYLSRESIRDMIGADRRTLRVIKDFLQAYNLSGQESYDRSYMHVQGKISDINNAFKADLRQYIHKENQKVIHISLVPYSLPLSISKLVDMITGFTYFPIENLISKKYFGGATVSNINVGPAQLRQRYNVSAIGGLSSNNSQAVAEFQDQYYSPSDLTTFFNKFVSNSNQSTVSRVVGTNVPSSPGVEASLDIQYIMGVNPNTKTYFYYTPGSFWDAMVTWADTISNEQNPALVHSVSYGWQFFEKPSNAYKQRLNSDFQKISSRGVSIIFASGDYGAGCIACYELSPSFPATCQYVTSVGATRFQQQAVGPEEAVIEFKSGGGFSEDFPRPSYQFDAVNNYLTTCKDLPASSRYHAAGRATPDVSALGIGFQVVVSGGVEIVGGTSASAPTFSAIISLLNDIRLSTNAPPLGFLNPLIYSYFASNSTAFYDVTIGDNPHSCCLKGFSCQAGYDPVTGVGTPNYEVLKQLVVVNNKN